ncbi:DUF7266 family protein [Halomarina pelagica]|uniref:DUF7266 family protein n=1 Tax=Halomarina pelagica TaxID=2961599 RepID=UPI0020C3ECCF|nr:hypothetical protein [Halomarina sp. BND7]
MDSRGVTPVVGKVLEAGIVVLYIGLLTTTLYGGVVPGYRSTAGDAVGDRTLAAAAERIQQAVPPEAEAVDVRVRVDLPPTIRGERYRIRADGETLVLDHPHPAVGGRVRLALPPQVARVEGSWTSDEPAVVRVRGADGGVVVRLKEREGTPGERENGRGDGEGDG